MTILVRIRSYIRLSTGTDGGDKCRIGRDFHADSARVLLHISVNNVLFVEAHLGDIDFVNLLRLLGVIAPSFHLDFFCIKHGEFLSAQARSYGLYLL